MKLCQNHRAGLVCRASLLIVCSTLAVSAGPLPTVAAARQPVTNSYHGVMVVDDYQWLEEAAAPAVREWTRLQNERTRAYFSRLQYREGLAEQLMQIRSE